MSIPNKRERKVPPTHPGVMLREDFLPEYGLERGKGVKSHFHRHLGSNRVEVCC